MAAVTKRAVLRRFCVKSSSLSGPPARLEAKALEHVAAAPVPTPALLVCEPDGHLTGVPSVLMTGFAGQPRWGGRPRTRCRYNYASRVPVDESARSSRPASATSLRRPSKLAATAKARSVAGGRRSPVLNPAATGSIPFYSFRTITTPTPAPTSEASTSSPSSTLLTYQGATR